MIKSYIRNIKLFSRNAKLFLIGNFCLSIGVNIFWLLYNLYLKEMGFQEGFIGNILSLRSVGSVLIALPAAALINRVHIRYVVIGGALFSALGFLLQSVLTTKFGLIIAGFYTGMTTTFYMVASAPFFMRNSTGQERVYLFSINSALGMGAGIFGSVLGGVVKSIFFSITHSEVISYRFALISAVVIALLGIIPYLKLREKPIPPREHKGMEYLKIVMKETNWNTIFKLALPAFVVGMGAGLTIPFINLYFRDVFHLKTDVIGYIFAMGQGAVLLGMLSSPIIANRIGKVRTILLTQIISIPFMLILGYIRFIPIVILAFLVRGALMNMSVPVSNTFSMEKVSEKEHAITNSILMLSWTSSWAISALIGGQIIEKFGFTLCFALTSSLYLLSTLLYYFFFRKDMIGKVSII